MIRALLRRTPTPLRKYPLCPATFWPLSGSYPPIAFKTLWWLSPPLLSVILMLGIYPHFLTTALLSSLSLIGTESWTIFPTVLMSLLISMSCYFSCSFTIFCFSSFAFFFSISYLQGSCLSAFFLCLITSPISFHYLLSESRSYRTRWMKIYFFAIFGLTRWFDRPIWDLWIFSSSSILFSRGRIPFLSWTNWYLILAFKN